MLQRSALPAKSARSRLALARVDVQVGSAEERARHEHAEVLGDPLGQLLPLDQRLAQGDVALQVLHDDERLLLVEMEHGRHHAGRALLLPAQSLIFEERAPERQRPALADQAEIGQRLLDDDRAAGPLDDEDEVQVAVADLAHVPARDVGADALAHHRDRAEPRRQRLGGQGPK